jgi:pimeloyl-[acyl-carrier protein] synthase
MLDRSTLEIDKMLVSREFLANPYPVLHHLREVDPVHWSDTIGGWVLTKYDDIVSTFREPASYSNEGRLARAVEYLPSESRARLQVFEEHYRTKGLLHSDPPDHTRLRRLVTKAFTPRMIEALRPRIQAIVNDLLDAGMREGGMDIIPGLAVALPITVLAEILGTPVADRVLFKSWADDLLAFQGVNKPAESTLLRSQETILEMKAYLTSLIRERKGRPGEDLISQLVLAESEGDKLSEAELLNTCITLLVAGHETTTSLIGNGIYLLLSNESAWSRLKSDRTLLSTAIEEILRYESPVSRQPRLMKSDVELSGNQIKKGQMVFQMLNAANRDPAYFTDPDTFDVGRRNNRHIAFGVGIHFCVGAVLSRTEGQIVFGTLLERAPAMHLVNDEPVWDVNKANSRMLKTLPVSF